MEEITLHIEETSCIRCGKCVRVCPAVIFSQKAVGKEIELDNVPSCILCGHCAAVCPTSSVIHSSFPPEKVHTVDASLLPTPGQLMLLCQSRRSNRAFSSKPVPPEMLEMILEAAHRAPTATNAQEVEYTLITNPVKLAKVSAFVIDVFSGIAKRLENPVLKLILKPILPKLYNYLPAFHRLIREHAKGNDLILRKATALILIHTPKDSRYGCQDANLAYQNGSLMAEALGVSQFYTGFVCAAIKQDKQERLSRIFGIKGTIHAGMALGMPAFKYPNYIDRKDIKVNRI